MRAVSQSDGSQPAPLLVSLATRINRALGLCESVLLCLFFGVLVSVGAGQALLSLFTDKGIPGSDELIRYMVFFIAMAGAAFTANQQRMISMDMLSRVINERKQSVLRVLSALLVIFLCTLVIIVSLKVRQSEMTMASAYHYISRPTALLALPIGASLIAFHYFLHLLFDLHFLRGGPPPLPPPLPSAKTH
jgi:TRAP-type C4-dicarboxylate transport system permease small subunit